MLNALLKQKGQTTSEGPAWSLNGNQGDRWKQAKVSIHPTASFQVKTRKLDQSDTRRAFLLPVALYFLLFVWLKYWFPPGRHIDVALHRPGILSRGVDIVSGRESNITHTLPPGRLLFFGVENMARQYARSYLRPRLRKVIIVSARLLSLSVLGFVCSLSYF